MNHVKFVLKGPLCFAIVDFEFRICRDPGECQSCVHFCELATFRTYQLGCVGLRSVPRTSAKGYLSPGFISWLLQRSCWRTFLQETEWGGVYSPISMAQIPVPAPMSRIFTGASFGSGQKCKTSFMTIFIIWWTRSRRSNSVFGQISIVSQSQCSWSEGVYIIIGHNVGCRSVVVSKHWEAKNAVHTAVFETMQINKNLKTCQVDCEWRAEALTHGIYSRWFQISTSQDSFSNRIELLPMAILYRVIHNTARYRSSVLRSFTD